MKISDKWNVYKQHKTFVMIKDLKDTEKRANKCIIGVSEKRKQMNQQKIQKWKEENCCND